MDLTQTLEALALQAVGFLILFVVLKQLAWRPILTVLDERRARIEDTLREAAQQRAELARLQAALNQRLATIDEEARAKIQEAVLEGRRVAVEIQEQARARSKEILTKSKDTIELELAKAKVTLRDELVDMTIEAVERLLKQKLDAKTDERLVASILEELDQSPTSKG